MLTCLLFEPKIIRQEIGEHIHMTNSWKGLYGHMHHKVKRSNLHHFQNEIIIKTQHIFQVIAF